MIVVIHDLKRQGLSISAIACKTVHKQNQLVTPVELKSLAGVKHQRYIRSGKPARNRPVQFVRSKMSPPDLRNRPHC